MRSNYHFFRIFAQCGKYDQNRRLPLFCSGWPNITIFSILLRMADMIKTVVSHTFPHCSKAGQISFHLSLCSGWQILPWYDSSFPYFKSGKQSWLKYHFFTLSLKIANLIKTSLSTCFLFSFGTINNWQTI